MSRIAATFARLAGEKRKALIPFVTAGDPSPAITVPLMHAMVEAGVDVIELGVPFSDPMADGPVIQRSSERALKFGVGLVDVLSYVREFRQSDAVTPVVLMGYANPVERYDQIHGAGAFVRDAAAAGVDGVLIVDYPPEECEAFAAALRAQGMDLIFLLAPTSTSERMAQVARVASGYVYYVSLKGVTGSGTLDTAAVERGQELPLIAGLEGGQFIHPAAHLLVGRLVIPQRADLGPQRLEFVRDPGGDHDIGALLGEGERDGPAHAFAGAGHEGGVGGQFHLGG